MKIILKSRLIVVFLVTFIPFTVIAQDRLSIAEVKDGLHVITGPGGNIGVRGSFALGMRSMTSILRISMRSNR